MKRIVVTTKMGYLNIPGDRIEFNEDSYMFFGYCGADMVLAIDSSVVMDIHVTQKREWPDGL